MKFSLEATELPSSSGRGNLSSRLVFTGERWQSIDLCVHGQRLRWQCAECIKYFKGREKAKKKRIDYAASPGFGITRPAWGEGLAIQYRWKALIISRNSARSKGFVRNELAPSS